MIDAIIEFSARNRFLVFLIVTAAVVAGVWSIRTVPLDAIPDLSDTQAIVYSRWDRSPDIVEDQVTYPIVTAMLGAPNVKAVRGFSDFGFSYVYIVFDEGTDIYWARSRTMEYLSGVLPRLPPGVRTELGPDATGVGWVFQYALVDTTGTHSLDELRTYQVCQRYVTCLIDDQNGHRLLEFGTCPHPHRPSGNRCGARFQCIQDISIPGARRNSLYFRIAVFILANLLNAVD
jgi:Cu/Ag efflux pump CusA